MKFKAQFCISSILAFLTAHLFSKKKKKRKPINTRIYYSSTYNKSIRLYFIRMRRIYRTINVWALSIGIVNHAHAAEVQCIFRMTEEKSIKQRQQL